LQLVVSLWRAMESEIALPLATPCTAGETPRGRAPEASKAPMMSPQKYHCEAEIRELMAKISPGRPRRVSADMVTPASRSRADSVQSVHSVCGQLDCGHGYAEPGDKGQLDTLPSERSLQGTPPEDARFAGGFANMLQSCALYISGVEERCEEATRELASSEAIRAQLERRLEALSRSVEGDRASWEAGLKLRDAQLAVLEAAKAQLELQNFQIHARLNTQTAELEDCCGRLEEAEAGARLWRAQVGTARSQLFQLQEHLELLEAERRTPSLGEFVVAAERGAVVRATHECDPQSAAVGRALHPGEVIVVTVAERYCSDCRDIGLWRGLVEFSSADERDVCGWVTLADPQGRCAAVPRADPSERPCWQPGSRVEAVSCKGLGPAVAVQPLRLGGPVRLEKALPGTQVPAEYVGRIGVVAAIEPTDGWVRCVVKFEDGTSYSLALDELGFGGDTLEEPTSSCKLMVTPCEPFGYHVRWDDPTEPDCLREPEELGVLEIGSSWSFLSPWS